MKYRVVIRETLHQELTKHLLHGLRHGMLQEEACLALWRRGDGYNRYTGVLIEVVLPKYGERDLHGNVTIHDRYLNRVLDRALEKNAGVAVLHSHPGPGWQSLSSIDEDTESNIVAPFVRETGHPLLGLTMGSDGVWSGRFWRKRRQGGLTAMHCTDVRRIGPRAARSDVAPDAYPPYTRREGLVRTIDCWGLKAQTKLARTHVCVVGAGSVGSMVLEALARSGFEEVTVIDDDVVEAKNLDRLVYADPCCIGVRKVDLAVARARRVATAHKPTLRAVPFSIRTERAYQLAADADIIICCVDNAEARDVLNHVAYSNCLPLIDGGVLVETRKRLLSAKWRLHLVGPDMRCLRCLGQYTSDDARDERFGIKNRGNYIDTEIEDGPEPGQNTFTFCSIVAAESMRILVRYLIGEDWWHDARITSGQWSFEHRFIEAKTDFFEHPGECVSTCEFSNSRLGLGQGGRPTYPFKDEPTDTFVERTKRIYKNTTMKMSRAIAAFRSY